MSEPRYAYYTRMMLGGAALILVVTAVMHGSSFFKVDALIAQPAIPDPWRDDVRALWLVYSVHLVLVAAILAYAALHPRAIPGTLLVLCGLFPAVDALLLVVFIGGVYGNVLLGLASVLVFGAAARGTTPIAQTSQS